ncbi:RagB/SusD family nutrient uptake outer membrane protein [Prevotella sp. KH2C16]|uniref:RagB/SusD family nutrient uptake outer membrane protein n=1 Tax=Prevotella sp. KH2C16 TaxID=1855325 RepID=UPI0008E12346|nr:RagB/SusD family nutrient uptake outer membrane protein [Prevotella sp. KH2C16]SFG39900.1 Starch-binding associating with outer membrane [Prevotella sp. KH2C16]
MKLKNIKVFVLVGLLSMGGFTSCNDYLDVVPDDGNATLENAFDLRSVAIRYLGTCYSYLTDDGYSGSDPALTGGDELVDLWGRIASNTSERVPYTMSYIARGYQNASSPYGNDWTSMYNAIRCCDNLIDNVHSVPDMDNEEKARWTAEAKFLKAFYHFNLIRKWGPVPIVRHSLPMDASVEDVRVYRDPIDSCFNYVLELLDEAIPDLPDAVDVAEYGRITQPIAAAFKARVACYAASPLFNGNDDESQLVDNRGVRLFPSKSETEKTERWTEAMKACKEAIDICAKANIKLYRWDDMYRATDSVRLDFTLRGVMCERWNSELIWGNTQPQSASGLQMWQQLTQPNVQYLQYDNLTWTAALSCYAFIGVPLKVVDQFYTNKGLPTRYDRDWQGVSGLDVVVADSTHKYYLEEGYETARMNVGREPRYYADLGFDGSKWIGGLTNYNDLTPEKIYNIECRMGKALARTSSESGPTTGYYPKKMYSYRNRISGQNVNMSTYWYPYPMMRLADLYLLYAEAINEAEGPNGAHSTEMFAYVDSIRHRANIPGVKEAWDTYSTNPGFYSTQTGMRQIIHQERLIELCFEDQRFWDLRRWKTASAVYAEGIYGLSTNSFNAEDYNKKILLYEQPFGQKDYFWPISTYNLEHNHNLVQNLGWK